VLTTVKREQLARDGKTLTSEEEASISQPILDKYDHEGSPYYSTARLWDDGILDPVDTRQTLALALSAAFNAPIPEPRFGVFRIERVLRISPGPPGRRRRTPDAEPPRGSQRLQRAGHRRTHGVGG